MSSSSTGGERGNASLRATVLGAAFIVVQAAVIGLAANGVNPHRLPWIRVPLRETHRVATAQEIRPPSAAQTTAPPVARSQPPAAVAPKPAQIVIAPTVPTVTATPATAPPKPPKPAPKVGPSPAVKPQVQAPPKVVAPVAAQPKPAPKKAEALFTSLKDAKALFDAKDVVFVDARHKEDYAEEHIAGARNIFADDVGTLYDGVLGGVSKSRTIVTYCSDPQCDAAIKLADALVARGHTRVFILLEGIPGWRGAGYATAKGETP